MFCYYLIPTSINKRIDRRCYLKNFSTSTTYEPLAKKNTTVWTLLFFLKNYFFVSKVISFLVWKLIYITRYSFDFVIKSRLIMGGPSRSWGQDRDRDIDLDSWFRVFFNVGSVLFMLFFKGEWDRDRPWRKKICHFGFDHSRAGLISSRTDLDENSVKPFFFYPPNQKFNS